MPRFADYFYIANYVSPIIYALNLKKKNSKDLFGGCVQFPWPTLPICLKRRNDKMCLALFLKFPNKTLHSTVITTKIRVYSNNHTKKRECPTPSPCTSHIDHYTINSARLLQSSIIVLCFDSLTFILCCRQSFF